MNSSESNLLFNPQPPSRICAPCDCTVLQVNVRKGEYINLAVNNPHMVLASDTPPQLRIQVDEDMACAINAKIQAEATIRDRNKTKLNIRFLRTKPIVIPKASFTGKVVERFDTRVLNVIYEVVAADGPIFIGQLVDVYFTPLPDIGDNGTDFPHNTFVP